MATVQDIPFRDIPHQSALFLSYLDRSPAALRFYQHAPTLENLAEAARNTFARLRFPRKEMAAVLRRQNALYRGDSQTLRQIDELEKPDSVAVLTGQQVGLFTGPLYTFYKALTAIHISEELRRRGIRAVPIFWMETEDHDLEEVMRRTVLDASLSVQVLDCRNLLFKEGGMPAGAVGSLRLPESIQEVVHRYLGYFPDSIWKPLVQSQLESTYLPGASLAQAFAQLMLQMLPAAGLVLFDPQDTEAKRLTSALFEKTLREADAIHAALAGRSRDLEQAGFHTQVSVLEHSTALFLFVDGERRALERRGSGFGLRHSARAFSLEDLLKRAAQTPEIFSPNVLLRPLIQDHLFPTLVYVGGSSELAYFAQVEALYRLFGRPMPVVWPRNSFTLVGPELGAEMDRLGIGIQDCFRGRQYLGEKTMRNQGFSKTALSLEKLQKHLDKVLTEIRPEVQAIEFPLVQALETARRKILHNVEHLKSQALRLEALEHSSISSAVDPVLNQCFPNLNLQERELGIQHFLARLGPSVVDSIRLATELGNFAHRVLRLDNKLQPEARGSE